MPSATQQDTTANATRAHLCACINRTARLVYNFTNRTPQPITSSAAAEPDAGASFASRGSGVPFDSFAPVHGERHSA